MPLDTSIYQNIQQGPSLAQSVEGGLQLGQKFRDMQNQADMRQAYSKNTDPKTGQLNQQAFLSDIGKANPQAAMQYQEQFAKMGKDRAESQSAQVEAAQKQISQVMPALEYLKQMPEDKRAAYWPQAMSQLKSMGVDTSRMGDIYDKNMFNQAYLTGSQMKDRLDAQKTQAETGKIQAEYGEKAMNRVTDYQKNLQGDELYKKNTGQLMAGKNALSIVDDAVSNPGSRAMLPVVLARFATGDQRINEMEADAFFKNQPAGSKIRQVYTDLIKGGLSQQNAEAAKQYITTAMQSAAENKSEIEMDHAKKFSAATGMPVERAYKSITAQAPGTLAQVPAGPARFAKNQPKDSGSVLDGTANASEAPSSAPPAGMLRMMSPDGKIRLIPKAQKGEAIAAGGSIMK